MELDWSNYHRRTNVRRVRRRAHGKKQNHRGHSRRSDSRKLASYEVAGKWFAKNSVLKGRWKMSGVPLQDLENILWSKTPATS